jgi:hypothetical protein
LLDARLIQYILDLGFTYRSVVSDCFLLCVYLVDLGIQLFAYGYLVVRHHIARVQHIGIVRRSALEEEL